MTAPVPTLATYLVTLATPDGELVVSLIASSPGAAGRRARWCVIAARFRNVDIDEVTVTSVAKACDECGEALGSDGGCPCEECGECQGPCTGECFNDYAPGVTP